SAVCWGNNMSDLGVPTGSINTGLGPELAEAGATLPVQSLGVGYVHSCAIDSTRSLFCCGQNNRGALGAVDGGTVTPALLDAGAARATVAAGYLHTCATTAGGGAVCIGDNGLGELGRGVVTGVEQALVPVVGSDGGGTLGAIVQLAAGG